MSPLAGAGFTGIAGAVCAPKGFRAAGVAAGIKRSGGLDLALIVSDTPATAAGVFTSHRAAAAPVQVDRERLAGGGGAQVIVVNAGCANAVTGARGRRDAEDMAALAAAAAGVDPGLALVCSTGKIGSHLPMDRIAAGITRAAGRLGPDDLRAADAILTTDTRRKTVALAHGDGWTIGGMAKGAGMISPDMATMLAFITTDAAVAHDVLQKALAAAVNESFNAITVDGECSTNDTVLVLANGASGVAPPAAEIGAALQAVCADLARAIVLDGEGATKFVRVVVTGARTPEEARLAARAVADSPLLKCALFGEDANWGRVAAALGKVEVGLDLERLSIAMGGVTLFDHGEAAGGDAESRAHEGLRPHEVAIECDLGIGAAAGEILTTDFSHGYVDINAEYEP